MYDFIRIFNNIRHIYNYHYQSDSSPFYNAHAAIRISTSKFIGNGFRYLPEETTTLICKKIQNLYEI